MEVGAAYAKPLSRYSGHVRRRYFGYHAVQGERGLVAWLRLSQEVERIEASLQIAVAERASLEHNVALLSPDGLDLDMLEERARVVLGLAHPQDFIVLSE